MPHQNPPQKKPNKTHQKKKKKPPPPPPYYYFKSRGYLLKNKGIGKGSNKEKSNQKEKSRTGFVVVLLRHSTLVARGRLGSLGLWGEGGGRRVVRRGRERKGERRGEGEKGKGGGEKGVGMERKVEKKGGKKSGKKGGKKSGLFYFSVRITEKERERKRRKEDERKTHPLEGSDLVLSELGNSLIGVTNVFEVSGGVPSSN